MPNTRRKFLINLSLATAGLGMPGITKGTSGSDSTYKAIGREPELSNLIEIDISEADFSNVPNSARPWVYYWWLKGNVTRKLITRDLEAMKAKGIGGFLLFDSRAYHDGYYNGNIPVPLHIKLAFMSPQWLDMVQFTMQEAARLGLQMSMNIANSGGALRGPWDFQERGPKKLMWSAVSVQGAQSVEMALGVPEGKKYFRDIGLIAVRLDTGKSALKESASLDGDWYDVVTPTDDTPVLEGPVVDLEKQVTAGVLQWEVPEGRWRIIRFATVVIGVKGDVDILDATVVEKYFTLIGDNILKKANALKEKVLKHLYNVSWEGENPDWTTGFEQEFAKYRGYDIKPNRVMLTGIALKSNRVYKKFMRDYYRTLSDCFRHNCYETIGRLCHEKGMQWHSENGGPWRRFAPMLKEADQLEFWGTNDMPQGEFWCSNGGDLDKKSNIRYTAMAAHTYGRPLVATEAFTSMGYHWTHYPAFLKPFIDINLVEGANFFIWHTFTASPLDIGKPGYEYFAGTHINPNVTWFDKVGPFVQYLGRCQYLLQQGQYVADVCCYVSDKNYVKWGRAKKWNDASSLSPQKGYGYDLLDTHILVDELEYKDGNLVLSSGMVYRVLVVDVENDAIPLEAVQKMMALTRQGATIILGETVPVQTPGLHNAQKEDNEVARLADRLWGRHAENAGKENLGKGKVYRNTSLHTVLSKKGIRPDFEGPFEYIHKRDGQKDIYFLRGQGSATCTFRVEGKCPEIWDPQRGTVHDVLHYRLSKDGRTVIPIDLPENGSVFIVFRKKEAVHPITAIEGPDHPEIIKESNRSATITTWKGGTYTLTDARNKRQTVPTQIHDPIALKGPWKVTFRPATGAKPIATSFSKLQLWNTHKDPDIKYFSGDATYEMTFTLTKKHLDKPARLKFGKLFDIARVWINDEDIGIVWTAPWLVELTGQLKRGKNRLKIEVTNCWRNRLIGDAGLPEHLRTTQTNVRLVANRNQYKNAFEAYAADDPLAPAGLAGPVVLEFGDKKKVLLQGGS